MKQIILLLLVCLATGVMAQSELYGDGSLYLDDIWSGDVIVRIDKSDIPSEDKRGIDFLDALKTLVINNVSAGNLQVYSDEYFEKLVPTDSLELGRANTLFVREHWKINQNKTWLVADQVYLSFAYTSPTLEEDETLGTFKWQEIEPLLMDTRVPYKSNLSSLVTYYDIFKLKLFPYRLVEVLDQKVREDNFQQLYDYVVDAVEGIVNE